MIPVAVPGAPAVAEDPAALVVAPEAAAVPAVAAPGGAAAPDARPIAFRPGEQDNIAL